MSNDIYSFFKTGLYMKVNIYLIVFCLIITSYSLFAQAIQKITQEDQRNRVIILTDIEADSDDSQSMVRLLLYSNEVHINGLIATISCWHNDRVDPESRIKIIQACGKVQPNLVKHEAGFPEAEVLLKKIKHGLLKFLKKKINVRYGFPYGEELILLLRHCIK